jgi:hypothetical protein
MRLRLGAENIADLSEEELLDIQSTFETNDHAPLERLRRTPKSAARKREILLGAMSPAVPRRSREVEAKRFEELKMKATQEQQAQEAISEIHIDTIHTLAQTMFAKSLE